jgi:hypothetical protein
MTLLIVKYMVMETEAFHLFDKPFSYLYQMQQHPHQVDPIFILKYTSIDLLVLPLYKEMVLPSIQS